MRHALPQTGLSPLVPHCSVQCMTVFFESGTLRGSAAAGRAFTFLPLSFHEEYSIITGRFPYEDLRTALLSHWIFGTGYDTLA